MSETLDFRRLYLLLSKHWFENRKAYSLFFLCIAAFLIGWFFFMLMISSPYGLSQDNQASIYFAGLFIAGCISASLLFRDFYARPRKINYFLLPAATLEKLLCALFYGVLIFFIAYTLIFYLTDIVAVKIANDNNSAMMASNTQRAAEWRQMYNITGPLDKIKTGNVFLPSADMFIFYPGDNIDFFTAFFPMQSAFILGAVYFNRNAFFKTIVVLLVIWMLFFIMEDKLFFSLLPPDGRTFRLFTAFSVSDASGNEQIYSLPYWIGNAATFFMRFGITPVLWIATYYRMKEKEI